MIEQTMNESLIDSNSTLKEDQGLRGPGLRLRKAREAMGCSVEDVANQLNFTVSFIISIESDDYRKIHNDVFTRGYLRAYSKFVGLPEAEIIAEFDQLGIQKETHKPTNVQLHVPRKVLSERLVPWISGLVIFIILLFIFLWWHNEQRNTTNSPASQNAITTKPTTKTTNPNVNTSQQSTPLFNNIPGASQGSQSFGVPLQNQATNTQSINNSSATQGALNPVSSSTNATNPSVSAKSMLQAKPQTTKTISNGVILNNNLYAKNSNSNPSSAGNNNTSSNTSSKRITIASPFAH